MLYFHRIKYLCLRWLILLLKKTELLSSVACRFVQITGKHKDPVHPKHLIQIRNPWYISYIKHSDLVLDVGCHNGQHTLKIANKCKKIYGIDINIKAIVMAKKEAKRKNIRNIYFKQTNIENKLPFKSKIFNKVILLDVLEHIINRDQLLKEIRRILKTNGLLLLSIPNSQTSWKRLQRKYLINSYSDPDHKIEYSKKQIISLLRSFRFKILNISPVVYDTSLVGFIDVFCGISLFIYKKIIIWRRNKIINNPIESIGMEIVCQKV